ncbi:MAG TPA: chromosome segregation protein SMC, partial [Hellea balneolensis]|nr:chromosome segregation protein SMC [Hellea balneolensis]
GDVWRWDGFVASRDVIPAAAVRLENKNRLAEIERELATLKTQLGEAETRWKEAKDVRQIKQEEARAARAQIPALEEEDRKARAALSAFEMERARRAEQKSALTDRLNRLETEHTAIIAALEEAKARLETCQPDAAAEQEIGELQARLEQARAEADEAGARYLSLKNERDARAARLQSVEQEIRDWQARAAQARQRITSLEGRLSETETALQAANDSPDEFTRRRQKILAELREAETRRNNASDALVEIETALREAEARLKTAEGDLGQAREARAAAEARLVSAQERKQEIQARIHETLSCEPHELKDKLEDLSPESKMAEHDIERKLERLVRERENLGSVNLRADEEAVEQEERLAAMTDEKQDLLAAIAKLREGIESLNAEGRQRLLDAFDTVNAHFGQLFTTLFGGGHASLNLSESDDPLEAGLEILVSPPGKRLGNMSLMSGGEQALTATALIFAVFLSNPAPICVLDEVDAPLDDANVERYCNLLDEMVKQTETKFIAITHNPVTMARMDRLFGVTMAEQGVSQLLSIDLGTAERLTA